jgi:hypothetical protein
MTIGRFLNASMAMFLALTVLSVPYSAVRAEQANPVAKACVADIKAKCAGQDSVKDCLIEHFGALCELQGCLAEGRCDRQGL